MLEMLMVVNEMFIQSSDDIQTNLVSLPLDVLVDALHLLHPHLVLGEAAAVVCAPVSPHVHTDLPLLAGVNTGVVESGVEDGRPSQ